MMLKYLKRLPFSSISSSSFSSAAVSTLKIGDVMKKSRRFSHQDVLDFSNLTHDSNPLHVDSESAQNAGFDDYLVHEMLVAALFPRIIASYFPGAVYISQSLQFKLPVDIDDEVVAEVQASCIREHKKRHFAKFVTKCFKNGELVIDGEATAMLPTLTMNEDQYTSLQ